MIRNIDIFPPVPAVIARASALATPLATVTLGVVLTALPWGALDATPATPAIAWGPVYFWTMQRPDLVPAFGVFAAGVLHDAVTGAPLGLSALSMLVAQAFILTQRRSIIGRSFLIGWLGFAIFAGVAAATGWAAAAVYRSALLSPAPFLGGAAISVALYPAIAAVLVRLQPLLRRHARKPR